jgi:hypothetical protein
LEQCLSNCGPQIRVHYAYNILVGKPKGKTPLGRPRRKWKVILVIHLREIGWEILWKYLAYDMDHLWALVNTVMNLQVP